jgi:hypothetical protein
LFNTKLNLPDQGVPLGPVLTAATLIRGSLISTNEAKDIVQEVEIDMANPGKKFISDSTLVFHPIWSLWHELICPGAVSFQLKGLA